MKKIVLVVAFLSVYTGFSQEFENMPKNNELSLNTYELIALKRFEISYERILNEESSFGISVLKSLQQPKKEEYIFGRDLSITPYYRHFFSDGYARGFFMDAFLMYNSGKRDIWLDDSNDLKSYSDVAFGIGLGGKFISRKAFVGTIQGGIGRNLFDNNAPEVVGRLEISFGFRF